MHNYTKIRLIGGPISSKAHNCALVTRPRCFGTITAGRASYQPLTRARDAGRVLVSRSRQICCQCAQFDRVCEVVSVDGRALNRPLRSSSRELASDVRDSAIRDSANNNQAQETEMAATMIGSAP